MKRVLTALMCMLAVAGCGLLGDDTPGLQRIRGGGTGPFRSLTTVDTGLPTPPEGRIATDVGVTGARWGTHSFGRIAWNEAGCFVSMAQVTQPPPPRGVGLPPGEPDLGQLEPTGIATCTADEGALTTTTGELVLTPTEAWEGGDLRDPWGITLGDGTTRLYYAAAGGIGVAGAGDVSGPFVRAVSGPVLTPIDPAFPLGSPSVIAAPDGGYLMYVDDGRDIYVARSDDGLAFAFVDTDEETPAIDPLDLSPAIELETTRLHPGAIVAESVAGRRIVRLYFDVAADGDDNIVMAGSFDGVHFERVVLAAYRSSGVGYPVPRILAGDETVLSLTRKVSVASVALRVPVGAVAPIFSFDGGI